MCLTRTCWFVSCEFFLEGGGSSNDRLWEGLCVCVVSDSTQGVSSMSEHQRQIDWVKVLCYVCNERSAICEGVLMILSNNPPFLKSMSPIFSPSRTPKTRGSSAVRSSDKASPVPPHPTPSQTAPCQTQQLSLGWIIVQGGGGSARPRVVGHWMWRKWLEDKERDRLWLL